MAGCRGRWDGELHVQDTKRGRNLQGEEVLKRKRAQAKTWRARRRAPKFERPNRQNTKAAHYRQGRENADRKSGQHEDGKVWESATEGASRRERKIKGKKDRRWTLLIPMGLTDLSRKAYQQRKKGNNRRRGADEHWKGIGLKSKCGNKKHTAEEDIATFLKTIGVPIGDDVKRGSKI